MPAFGDPGLIQHPIILVEIPDVFHKLPVKSFRAAFRHVGASFSPVQNDALEHAPEAGPSAVVQINDGVASGMPGIHGAAVVAVNDPAVQIQRVIQPFIKFFHRNILPVSVPPEPAQVYHGQIQLFPQFSGKGRLTTAGTTNNDYSFHFM